VGHNHCDGSPPAGGEEAGSELLLDAVVVAGLAGAVAAVVLAGAGVRAGAVVVVEELGVFKPLVVADPVEASDEAVLSVGRGWGPLVVTPVFLPDPPEVAACPGGKSRNSWSG
jgi:hypothetical protein